MAGFGGSGYPADAPNGISRKLAADAGNGRNVVFGFEAVGIAEVCMAIRNACKALLVRDGKILLNKNLNTIGSIAWGLPDGAVYYDLPGGGQNQYETLAETVVRECLEETGYTVEVKRLAAVYEEISMNERFRAQYEKHAHRVHFIFQCEVTNEPRATETEKDMDMLQSEWVEVADVENLPLYPVAVKENLRRMLTAEDALFLGSKREGGARA